MADLNPISQWRRMLAQPNDSRAKTVFIAFVVAALCAVLVSGVTVILRPIQAANRAAEQEARLGQLVAAIPGMQEMLAQTEGGRLSTVVIELERGRAAPDLDPETLQTALDQPANWTALTPAQDIAGIGSRPDYAQVFLLRQGEGGPVELLILPVAGFGYNGRIEAMVALRGDMRSVAGMAITEQSETPGLGARIAEPAWLSQFAGRRVADDRGQIRFAVARGPAASDYEVDGITGATRTGNAVTGMMRFWLGPDGYGPLLDAIRRGEF
ncbi:MAG: NADH:ubiquinone reductase (Na(+)-transporting) subunit C [Paracoccus sp. (in: a-proteobacteria)]|nr:NADH:ubiquinone reductase (Na(+)-transporting) subunit C [Paracoccus sp. (in: a-proteobacteria)]